MSNLDYCPLVWHFTSSKSSDNIENIQKRCLRFIENDFVSDYENLLTKANKTSLRARRIKFLCQEIYKTIHSLNPPYMKTIFQLEIPKRQRRKKDHLNLVTHRPNNVSFGEKSLKVTGSKIWNILPYEIKSGGTLPSFKKLINKWKGLKCKCNECNFYNPSYVN